MPVCHLHTETSQLWAHGDVCIPSEKGTGRQPYEEVDLLGPLSHRWAGHKRHECRALEQEELAGAIIWLQLPHSPFLLMPQEQRSQEPASLTLPAGLSSSLFVRDSAPSPHLFISDCMNQKTFIGVCVCIYLCICICACICICLCEHVDMCTTQVSAYACV